MCVCVFVREQRDEIQVVELDKAIMNVFRNLLVTQMHGLGVGVLIQKDGGGFFVLFVVKERMLGPCSNTDKQVKDGEGDQHQKECGQWVDTNDSNGKAPVEDRALEKTLPHRPILLHIKVPKAIQIEGVGRELIGKEFEHVVPSAEPVVGEEAFCVFLAIGVCMVHLHMTGTRELGDVARQRPQSVLEMTIQEGKLGAADPLRPSHVSLSVQAAEHVDKELEPWTVKEDVVCASLVQALIPIAVEHHVDGGRPQNEGNVESVVDLEPISVVSEDLLPNLSDDARLGG